ncbi:hypothetical protein LX36DRAFT_99450 [Colletotrichum falcatum]|nr:hypothetical protein LX36DRAFT_99450 [Colletotrichum falcatum]
MLPASRLFSPISLRFLAWGFCYAGGGACRKRVSHQNRSKRKKKRTGRLGQPGCASLPCFIEIDTEDGPAAPPAGRDYLGRSAIVHMKQQESPVGLCAWPRGPFFEGKKEEEEKTRKPANPIETFFPGRAARVHRDFLPWLRHCRLSEAVSWVLIQPLVVIMWPTGARGRACENEVNRGSILARSSHEKSAAIYGQGARVKRHVM